METCMLLENPGPKSRTVTVEPRETMVPVLSADPPELVVAPSAWALGGGLEAGRETAMSIPEAAWPPARLTTVGAFTPPVLGGGEGLGLGLLLDAAGPDVPQPLIIMMAVNKTTRQNSVRVISLNREPCCAKVQHAR